MTTSRPATPASTIPLRLHYVTRNEGFGSRSGPTLGGLLLLLALAVAACSDSSTGPGQQGAEKLTPVEGQGLQAPAGTVLPSGPTVEVRGKKGEPLRGKIVTFEVLEGGGRVPYPEVETDSLGRATAIWILGNAPGERQRLRASMGSLKAEFEATTVEATPGQKYSGRQGYIDYYAGNVPLILHAPQGGDQRPAEMRGERLVDTVRFAGTAELALEIRQALHERTGGWAHVVINNLHPINLYPDRELVSAAMSNQAARRAWWEYHTYLEQAVASVGQKFGEGLVHSIRGHDHPIPRVELGYLTSQTSLTLPDEVLDSIVYVSGSSVRGLASKPGKTLSGIIRGPKSLGTLLENRGYPATPSQSQPMPGMPGQVPYLNGAFSTNRYGSRDGGPTHAIQLAHYTPGLLDTEANRRAYAVALVDALIEYFAAHLRIPLAPR